METSKIKEKVNQAKEAVEDLEEPLKTEAFRKVLDNLLNLDHLKENDLKENWKKSKNEKTKKKSKSKTLGEAGLAVKKELEGKKRKLSDMLNRSEHPLIYKLEKVLPQSMYLLKIMKEKNVESLTPPEIQFILKETFGIKSKAEHISTALNRKGSKPYTDRTRIRIGKTVAYKYNIMKAGEDYIGEKIKNGSKNE